MKFKTKVSPHLRSKQSTLQIMVELTIALLVLVVTAAIYYTKKVNLSVGLRVIFLALAATLTNIVIEVFFGILKKENIKTIFKSQFPWVTGLIFALCVPVTTSYYATCMAVAIGVIFGKVVFGGFGQNIFNPAGISRAIIFSSFSAATVESVSKSSQIFSSATPANLMSSFSWMPSDIAFTSKAFNHITLKTLFFGDHFGTIGETFAIVLIIVGIILAIRKVIDYRTPLFYLGTLFIATFIIGSINGLGIWYPLAFIMSGGVLFGAVFMLTDPVTNPTQKTGRIIFAIGAAILTMIIRYKANLPEGVVFSILIMNMLTPIIENILDGQQTVMKKKYITSLLVMFVIAGFSVTWIVASVKPQDPVIEVNEPTNLDNENIDKFAAEIVETKTLDSGNTLYTVSVEGYGLVEAQYPNPNYKENIFEIEVDSNQKIVLIEMIQFGDTVGFGDKVDDALFLEKFINKDLNNASEQYDTATSATFTSYSLLSSIKEVIAEIGN